MSAANTIEHWDLDQLGAFFTLQYSSLVHETPQAFVDSWLSSLSCCEASFGDDVFSNKELLMIFVRAIFNQRTRIWIVPWVDFILLLQPHDMEKLLDLFIILFKRYEGIHEATHELPNLST